MEIIGYVVKIAVGLLITYFACMYIVKPALGLDVIIEQNQAILDELRKQNKL